MCFYLAAEQLVQKKVEEVQNKVDLQQDVEGAYLTHLLLSEKMTVTEILGSITELLLAGVDTVSAQRGGGAVAAESWSPPVDRQQPEFLCCRPPTPSPGLCTNWHRIQASRASYIKKYRVSALETSCPTVTTLLRCHI